MSGCSSDVMQLQGFCVGRIPRSKLVGVTPNHASENPSYTKSL